MRDKALEPAARTAVLVEGLSPLLERLLGVFAEGPAPPAQSRDLVRVLAVVKSHQWRWTRALKQAGTLGQLALLVAQFRQMVLVDKTGEAAMWEEETFKELV